MLSDEEQEHIKLEETYRYEIRRQLGKGAGGGFWKFLNSAFGIWLMSTLIVSYGTFAYTKWADNRQREIEKKSMIKSLDLEISNRLYYFDTFATDWVSLLPETIVEFAHISKEKSLKEERIEFQKRMESALRVLDNDSQAAYNANVITSLKGRSFISLVTELYRLDDSEQEKNEISYAINIARKMGDLNIVPKLVESEKLSVGLLSLFIKNQASYKYQFERGGRALCIVKYLNLKRWGLPLKNLNKLVTTQKQDKECNINSMSRFFWDDSAD